MYVRILAALATICLVAGCRSVSEHSKGWRKVLNDPAHHDHKYACGWLMDTKRVPNGKELEANEKRVLRHVLAHKECRPAGIQALGRAMQRTQTAQSIARFAKDPSPEIRALLPEALVQARRRGVAVPIKTIINALSDRSPKVRAAARISIAKLDRGMLPTIYNHYVDKAIHAGLADKAAEVRRETLGMLHMATDPMKLIPRLLQALQDPHPLVREKAAICLGQLCVHTTVPSLIIPALGGHPRPRCAALRALGDIGDRRAAQIILAALKDKDPVVREAAIYAASSSMRKILSLPLAIIVLQERPTNNTAELLALKRMPGDIGAHHFVELAKGTEKTQDIITALRGLAVMGSIRKSDVPAFCEFLKHEDDKVRLQAVQTASSLARQMDIKHRRQVAKQIIKHLEVLIASPNSSQDLRNIAVECLKAWRTTTRPPSR